MNVRRALTEALHRQSEQISVEMGKAETEPFREYGYANNYFEPGVACLYGKGLPFKKTEYQEGLELNLAYPMET